MANNCSCGGRLGNTGIDNCVIEFKTTSNFIITPTYDGDNNLNYIDLTTPATVGSDVLAKVQATTDALERLYPLPYAENITRDKSERLTETPASGNIYSIQDGVRVNHSEFFGKNAHFRFASELEKFGCTALSYYAVDIAGTMEGYLNDSEPTKFYPIPMMPNSFDLMYQYATDTTIQKLFLDFNMKRNFDETQIYYLTSADLGYPATDLVGLVPCTIETVSGTLTTTGITVDVLRPTQSALTKKPFVGLVLADFDLQDLTTPGTVTITGVTEIADGRYELTYSAVAGENEFELSISKSNFYFEPLAFTDPS